MKIIGIWAQSQNGVIGQYVDGKFIIPWKFYKEDITNFKLLTKNKVILMGYNTYLSIGKALPNRKENLVLTNSHYDELNVLFKDNGDIQDVKPVKTIEEAIRITKFLGDEKLYIIGGKSLYVKCLNEKMFDIIIQTIIPKSFSTDSNSIVMPNINRNHYYIDDEQLFSNGMSIRTWFKKS